MFDNSILCGSSRLTTSGSFDRIKLLSRASTSGSTKSVKKKTNKPKVRLTFGGSSLKTNGSNKFLKLIDAGNMIS